MNPELWNGVKRAWGAICARGYPLTLRRNSAMRLRVDVASGGAGVSVNYRSKPTN